MNKRLQNHYPEDVFPPMDLEPVSDYLIAGGYSPDRVFGNWGRQVWDNAVKKARMEFGEWLERNRPSFSENNSRLIKALRRGEVLE